jgi:hypothetical protein
LEEGILGKKRGPLEDRALLDVKVKTSRGEQLLRWHWEEKDHHLHQLQPIWESAGNISMLGAKKNCNFRDVPEIKAKKEGHKKNLGPL